MSGTATTLPVQITLTGLPQVEAGLKKVGDTAQQAMGAAGTSATAATSSMGRFNQVIQQGGYQLGDFAVQVQGGQSALVALSQQGSQFLGMFGPVGAVAGVALTLGTIAAGFLSTASAADVAKTRGQEALDAMARSAGGVSAALREVNGLFQSAAERAATLANLERGNMRTRYSGDLTSVETGLLELRRKLSTEQDYLRDIQAPGSGTLYRAEDNDARNRESQAIVNVRTLRSEIAAAERAADGLRTAIQRVDNSGLVGAAEFGPTSADPFGVRALEARLSPPAKIEQSYQADLVEIRAKLRDGLITEAKAAEFSAAALAKRNEELRRESSGDASRASAAARAAARERAAEDKKNLGEITEMIREQNREYDRYQDDQKRIFDRSQLTIEGYRETLEYMEKESGLLSGNADERGRELAILKEVQAIQKERVTDEEQIAERLRLTGELYDKQLDLTQRKNSFTELARVGEQAFDRIGNAITSAFADGSMKAIDFGQIAKGVMSEIAQAALRMAVVNPVLNATFGGQRGTVSGLMSGTALSSGGGTVSAAAGGVNYITEYGGGALSLGKSLMGTGMSNTGWGWLDSGLNATAYSYGGNAAASGIGQFADTGMTTGSHLGSSTGATSISYGSAIGGAAGIAGGLYGIYTGAQTGGAKGWAQGISGTAGVVAGGTALAGGSAAVGAGAASALGASAGAALGAIAAAAPYIAVIALVASYFLSGQKPSDRTGVYRANLLSGVSDVTGLEGDRFSQENRDLASNLGRAVGDMASSLRGALGVSQTPFRFEVAAGARDGLVASYNGKEREFSNDEAGAKQLISELTGAMIDSMKGLASAEVQSVLSRSSGVEATLSNLDWYNSTYKPLTDTAEVAKVSSYATAVKNLSDQFQPLAQKATELGLALDPVTAALTKGVEALNKARVTQFDATINDMLAGAASLGGGNQLGANLSVFDRGRTAEWEALDASIRDQGFDQSQVDTAWGAFTALKALQRQQIVDQDAAARAASSNALMDRYQAATGNGDTLEGARWDYERRAQAEWFAASKDGYTDLTELARVQAAERLRIERDFAEQAKALDSQRREQAQESVIGTLGGITQLVRSMQTDDSSLLSPQAKLGLLQRDFEGVAGRAAGGDFEAVGEFASSAGAYRNAARDYYGSSAGFAEAQGRILAAAENIGNLGADALTKSSMETIMRNSSDTTATRIVAAINDLKTENQLLRNELRALVGG